MMTAYALMSSLLIQPQLPLARVVLAVMDDAGAAMEAFVTFASVQAIDEALGALAAARVAVFGDPDALDAAAARERTWRCAVGDDCRCALDLAGSPPRIPQCAHYQGFHR